MGGSHGAAIKIAPDQRHLYVSGRTQSQIAAFEIDQESKQLKALACVDTGGISPRDFSITPDGSFLVIANEKSDSVTSLRRDKATGLLEPTGYGIDVGSPVCILI
jgi:6-phosphogluconolactonase